MAVKEDPPKLLEFNPNLYSVLTIDLRLTEVYGAITNLVGNIHATSAQHLTQIDPMNSIQELIEITHNLLQPRGEHNRMGA